MSWKDEIRKKDKVNIAERIEPADFRYLDKIEVKDRDGNKLTPRQKMTIISKLQEADFKDHKEILDKANVDMREFTKFLYKVKLPYRKPEKERMGEYRRNTPAFQVIRNDLGRHYKKKGHQNT